MTSWLRGLWLRARYYDTARRRFGNRTSLEEHRRTAIGVPSLETLGQDIRYVLRTMRHSPGFSTMVVATLGTVPFSVSSVTSVV